MNVLFALGGVLIAEGGEHAALLLEVGSASPDHGCCSVVAVGVDLIVLSLSRLARHNYVVLNKNLNISQRDRYQSWTHSNTLPRYNMIGNNIKYDGSSSPVV